MKSLIDTIKKKQARRIEKMEKFDHSVNVEKNINFLPWNLQNPDIRVDIAYSIFANKNYDLLPEVIAVRDSVTQIEERSIKLMQKKRKIEKFEILV